jgi:hypothetical protein
MSANGSVGVVAQVAEKLGFNVTVGDFVSVGTLRPTEVGIARCMTDDFAKAIHVISEQQISKPVKEELDGLFALYIYTTGVVCADKKMRFAVRKPRDLTKFVTVNLKPLARLMQPAFASNFPALLKEMGV